MRMKCVLPLLSLIFLGSPIALPAFAQQPASPPASSAAKSQREAKQTPRIAPPAHPITLAQTEEMFRLMHFQATMQATLRATLERERERAPFIPEDVWQDFEASFAKADFIPVYLPVYQKYLSQEDAAKAIEFYRTPAGQHTLSVLPDLIQDVGEAAQKKGEEIARQVFERHHQEIEDAARKYQEQNAPPPPPAGSGQGK